MSDSFTETTSTGWFGRIGQSIKGILIGLLLFVVSFPLLFWNEGRSVKTYLALKEGESNVVEVTSDKVDPANQNKLVHITGMATTTDSLKDADFGVEIIALRLKRVAEIYQWTEKSESKKKKKLGGGEETVTTYTYEKVWSDRSVDSGKFKEPSGHINTGSLVFPAKTMTAPRITIGAFVLSSDLASSINNFEALPSANLDLQKGSESVKKDWKATADWIYRAANPGVPAIGDVRVKFLAAPPTVVSLFSQQTGDSFRPFATAQGQSIERLELGSHSAKEMFTHALSENTTLTWILRGVGLLLMWLGLTLIFKPLVVIADVVPFIGNVVQWGFGFVALMFALPLTLITIAVGWIFYRPVLGVSLIVGAVAVFVLFYVMGRKRKPA